MNRNVESHFSQVPRVDIERSIFDRSHTHKTSFNVGDLIPIDVQEVLPGDTVKMTSSKVVRLQTMLTPIMDNMYLDTFWFFVPNRLVWSHWKNFMGESESAWISDTTYSVPKITPPTNGWNVGTIADYLGIPPGVELSEGVNALPFRGYALICSEFFRDENLQQPVAVNVDDATVTGVNTGNQVTDIQKGGLPFKAAKFHDRFTSCLPAPQRSANPVTIPVLNNNWAPVETRSSAHDPTGYSLRGEIKTNSTAAGSGNTRRVFAPSTSNAAALELTSYAQDNESAASYLFFEPTNLWANLSGATEAVTISELRLAFQLQRFYERSAMSGNRYTEFLTGFFGVHSPDFRLQRPEYLGGNRIPINVHEVTNSAQSEADFLGDLGAKSATSDVHFDFEKSFTEHGFLFCLCCVRYDHTYCQGIEPMWRRLNFEQYYLPTFAHLGEMPVYSSELYLTGNNDLTSVFGYQEAWSEYRYATNRVSGEMRPGVSNSLASWHLADYYQSKPTLSASWIAEDKTMVDRVLAVTSVASNQCFADFYFDASWSRPMPMFSVPGLIDHF